jgi:ferredoxin
MAFAPDIFELRDDDNLYLLIERPEESMRGQVDAAVSGCPKAAITVTED